jgi:hypothetical protein
MIKNSILYTLCFLLAYSLFLRFTHFDRVVALNVQQSKYITVENFLYHSNPKSISSIIIGSSMSEKLNPKFLPNSVYNLSISGAMASTGIKIIELSGHKPKKIYVELNVFTRQEDSILLNSLNSPLIRKQKEFIPFLQERNQFFVTLLNALTASFSINKNRPPVSSQVLLNTQSDYLKKQNDSSNFELINQNIALLSAALKNYSKQNVQILLFRMPVEKSTLEILNNSTRLKFERSLIKKTFSNLPNISFVPEDNGFNYQTTDGIHLTNESAKHFADYLLKY